MLSEVRQSPRSLLNFFLYHCAGIDRPVPSHVLRHTSGIMETVIFLPSCKVIHRRKMLVFCQRCYVKRHRGTCITTVGVIVLICLQNSDIRVCLRLLFAHAQSSCDCGRGGGRRADPRHHPRLLLLPVLSRRPLDQESQKTQT